jgi:hypothetical protein
MRSRRSGPDWGYLRWLVESNLRSQPGFKKNFRLEDKLQTLGQGLFNRNYLFEAGGKALVLRLANELAEQEVPVYAVVVYELLFHLDWLADARKTRAQKRIGGHAPEHYAESVGSILRRAVARELNPDRVEGSVRGEK